MTASLLSTRRLWVLTVGFSILGSCALAAPRACPAAREIVGSAYRARFADGQFQYYAKGSSRPDLVYRLDAIRMGKDRFTYGARPEVIAAKNGVRLRYGKGISETYSALPGGVEQCWLIDRRPRSSGDIVIEATIRSPHRLTSSVSGLRFLDRRGRPVFRYGNVTVIDNRGQTYSCAPKISGGRLSISVPSSFVDKAEFPIVVDPVVGPEVAMVPTYHAAPDVQQHVEVAAGSSGYLAVWQDRRSGTGFDIFAARLGSDGSVTDKMAIAVSTMTGDQTQPAVAWNGRNYLVVWTDGRDILPHIYGARITADGEVLDKQGILLSGTSSNQASPRAASDGSSWLIVWQHSGSSSTDVYGAKLSSDGVPGTRTYGMATTSNNEEAPDVAWNGSYYLVVWTDFRNAAATSTDIYGCKVSKTGIRTGSDALISSDSTGLSGAAAAQRAPHVCRCGSNLMVVWEDLRRDGVTPNAYGTRVAVSGSSPSVLNVNGIAICIAAGGQELPAVGYDGAKLLVAWRNGGDRMVGAVRMDTAGAVLNGTPIAVSSAMASTAAGGVSVTGTGQKFLVAYSTLDPSNSDARTTIVTDAGSVQSIAGVDTGLALDDQGHSVVQDNYVADNSYAVADNGSDYAVVWSQMVNGSYDILGARVSHAGQLLTTQAVNLTSAIGGNQVQPAIAWNGSEYLLVWSGDESGVLTDWDIRGLRIRNDLTKIDLTAISISTADLAQARPCVASVGGNGGFCVAWEDSRNAASPSYNTDIYGAVVGSNGSVTSIAAGISGATGDQRKPRVASSGTNYFVAWEDYRPGYPRIYGSRVTTTGTVSDVNGIAFPATSYYQTMPEICYGGGNYFVTWSDWYAITGCRVSTAGVVLNTGGIPISGGCVKSCPSACWDGTRYAVVWEDYRSAYAGNADIYYAAVDSSGALVANSENALVSNLVAQLKPRILGSSSAGILFYSRYDNFSNCTAAVTLTAPQVQDVGSIGSAKQTAPGSLITVRGKIVTAAFTGYFYIEEPNRSNGIKVISNVPVSRGDLVDTTGTMTISDGERQINSSTLAALGTAGATIKPLGIRADALGGATLNGYTPGVTGGIGPNNLGLLVRTWGKVTSTGTDYFYVENKPGFGVKVKCGTLTKPAVGKMVSATGISTCEIISGGIARSIRARDQADIKLYN